MRDYGLLIEREHRHGTDYVIARLTSRENDAPYGCSADGERAWDSDVPKHVHGLQLDGLGIYGFVSDFNSMQYIGFEPEYRDVYTIDLNKSARMHKTLKKVRAAIEKEKAREGGDVFNALVKALKLTFVCERLPRLRDDYSTKTEWRMMSVADGRNRFRRLIEDTQTEMRARKAA